MHSIFQHETQTKTNKYFVRKWTRMFADGTRSRIAVMSVFISMLLCQSASAAQYFVAPTGNNAAAGTAAAPWRTLQYAADRVSPGDRVTARAGNYAGFYLDTSGMPGAPIEFFAEPGVLVNQPNPVRTDHGINLENASYVTIDGFAVTGMNRAGVRSVGVDGDEFASHVTIRNVHSYDNGYWGILTGFVDDLVIENNKTSGSAIEHGIYVSNSGDRPIIRNNISWDNDRNGIHINGDAELGGDGIISNALITGNIIYNNGLDGGSGINMDGIQNSRIENNLLYNNHASGISLYRIDGGGESTGNVVVNNTIHVANDGRWALNIKDGSSGNIAFNNIFVSEHPTYGAIDLSADSKPGFISDYNVVIPKFSYNDNFISLAQWRTQTGQDIHSIAAEPEALFENWPEGDYELLATASARDAGLATLAGKIAPLLDITGKSRPVGAKIDIGAYELSIATLPGDFNHNGTVDAADYTLWRNGLGTTYTQADYTNWKANFGQSAGMAGVSASVPEPASFLLVCTALMAAIAARSRV
jgi:hypothetical protein